MANKIFQDILKSDIRKLIDESTSINSINHNGIKGSIREFGIGKVLKKYLPQDFAIGSGQIHDSNGNQSNETDLLIYHKHILPPIMFEGISGLYPLESCFYVIEAKTTSNATEIKSTIQKFNALKTLCAFNNNTPIRVYIALASDLTTTSELERYKKYDSEFYSDPAINVICVLGQGYWYHKREQSPDGKWYGYWNFTEANDNYELAYLIAGIVNTLCGIKNNPPFGFYLLEDGQMKIVDQSRI